MSARAGIVVTGTEVLAGRVRDRNGPWLADRLLELGVELAHLTICGDRPEDMRAQLGFMAAQEVDLIITSGGLGPTADDLTTQVVAEFQGRALVLDEALEGRIAEIIRPLIARWRNVDPEGIAAGTRKQARVPEGAAVLEPAGTAPGVVVAPAEDRAGPTIVVLPGPPRELHAMWPAATETEAFQTAVRERATYRQRTLRLFGTPESDLAVTLREAEDRIERFDRLEITTCLRRAELEVVVRHEPEDEPVLEQLSGLIGERYPTTLFSTDGTSVDEQVAELLRGRTVAVAESCTGGLMSARLNERAGSSAYFVGGVVAYANEAKVHQLGVDAALIERHGAVSPEVADAMAAGALARLGTDVAVAITGVAGPGGGSDEKPVGYVCWSARTVDGSALARDTRLPGDRAEIRDRSTTMGMHLLRGLLRDEDLAV